MLVKWISKRCLKNLQMILVHIITFFYIYKSNFIYIQMNFPSMQWRSRNMQSCSRHTRTPKWMDMKNRNKKFFFFNFASNCTCSIGWYNGAGAESFSFVKLYFVKTVLHITNLKAACVTMSWGFKILIKVFMIFVRQYNLQKWSTLQMEL